MQTREKILASRGPSIHVPINGRAPGNSAAGWTSLFPITRRKQADDARHTRTIRKARGCCILFMPSITALRTVLTA
jgi:hypothetical protein